MLSCQVHNLNEELISNKAQEVVLLLKRFVKGNKFETHYKISFFILKNDSNILFCIFNESDFSEIDNLNDFFISFLENIKNKYIFLIKNEPDKFHSFDFSLELNNYYKEYKATIEKSNYNNLIFNFLKKDFKNEVIKI